VNKTLSIRAEAEKADNTAGWKISPARAEALKLRARNMRRNPTLAHAALWEQLRDKQLGFTFNREVVMGSAIVDFACKPRWLVVEISGETEANRTIEGLSDRKLTDVGIRVLRFTNEAVMQNIGNVLDAILAELQKPFEKSRQSSPSRPTPYPEPQASEAQPETLEEAEPQLPFPSGEEPEAGISGPTQPEDQATSLEGSAG
jgi:very-short-patch-repair endonuclease